MTNSHLKRLLSAGAALSLVLAFCSMRVPTGAQTANQGAVSTLLTNTTAASGSSDVLALDGKYSNCIIVAYNSNASAAITANGNTQQSQYGPGAPYVVNTSFGTNGVISPTSTTTANLGNMAQTPVGAWFSWSGNTGTLVAMETCSQTLSNIATITGTISGAVTAAITAPLCGGSVCTHDDHSPLPQVAATAGALASPVPSLLPVAGLTYYWNGTQWVAVTSTNPFPVTTPAPTFTALQAVHDSAPVQPSPLYTQPVTTTAPCATAVSPAPAGICANGVSELGSVARVVCDQTATFSTTTTTTSPQVPILVPSAIGKAIYICFWNHTHNLASATLVDELGYSTNSCVTITPLLFAQANSGTSAASTWLMGTSTGFIAKVPAGDQLCGSFQTGTSPASIVNTTVLYTQFLRSLTPQQMDDFCESTRFSGRPCPLFATFKRMEQEIP